MVFNAEAYEKVFPRKAAAGTVKAPEPVKPGNVLEEADKVEKPETPKPEPAPDPIQEPEPETGGGESDGA